MSQRQWKDASWRGVDHLPREGRRSGRPARREVRCRPVQLRRLAADFPHSAEDKLNTNKLRAVLQRGFRAKIDPRQIGPRDVAADCGMGACGIPRCCSTFLTDFSPISIGDG